MRSMHGYLTTRDGLPNFARKLATGTVTVGYLGGSLTMMKEGWRPMFHAWLNQAHPRAQPHRQLHVGRGGVGSVSGAFFVQDEICGHDPDLVFVEYAINDSFDFITPPALRLSAIEGIVRSIRMRHPACDICFVYMHHVLRGPEIGRVVDDCECVAAHYGIPSIHVGRYLTDLVSRGEWSFGGETAAPALLRDTCHPLPSGNKLITKLISKAVMELRAVDSSARPDLPPPFVATPMVGGRVMPLLPEMIRGPHEVKSGRVGNIEQEVRRYSFASGAHLEIQGDVPVVGLYVVVGPGSGVIRAQSGVRTVVRNLFDQWCSYERISTCILADSPADLKSAGGAMTIELTEQAPDYSVCPKLESIPVERTFEVVGLFTM